MYPVFSRSVMRRFDALRLAFALCIITSASNLQAPLYSALAAKDGVGVGATTVAFACYVFGIIPVLLALNGLSERVGRKPLILAALVLCLMATTLTLVAPGILALGAARFLVGVATALASSVAPGYMYDLFSGGDHRRAANWVTAATSLGFGLGPAVTSLFLLQASSLTPPSFPLYLLAAALAFVLVAGLRDDAARSSLAPLARLPFFPAGSLIFGWAILLAWGTVGLVIAILPSALQKHGLSEWSGFAVLATCSCGVLFQPLARLLPSRISTRIGLLILPVAYALIAWGALHGQFAGVLAGAVLASSACYGFIYLGGLSAVLALGEERRAAASAGFFLMAYFGFILPVMVTGVLVDLWGHQVALIVYGMALTIGVLAAIVHLHGKSITVEGRLAANSE